jgi:hypothetical protein
MNNIVEWKTNPDYPIYLFSSNGDIKNTKTGKLVPGSSTNGYRVNNLINKNNIKNNVMTHRIIATIFVDNPQNFNFIKHIDNNKLNNNSSNLQWVQMYCRSENTKIEPIDGEIWKDIIDFPNYQVSNKGRVKNIITDTPMKTITRNKYVTISLISPLGICKKLFLHRLVAQAFLVNPENKPTVDHIDRNPLNNNLENLRWATHAEQSQNQTHKKPNNKKEIIKHNENINDVNYENEVWRNINEFIPNAPNYKISNYGRFKNEDNDILIGAVSGGYNRNFIGSKKYYYTHILVALAFIQNPENKKVVNHKDGNKFNNKSANLEWVTHSENGKHAMDNNLHSKSKKIKVICTDTNNVVIYNNKKHIVTVLGIGKNTITKYMKSKLAYNKMLFEYA